MLGLPHDLFQLYIPTTIVTGKFDAMVTAMNLFVVALLGAGAMSGFLVFRRARLLRALALITAGVAGTVVALRLLLALIVDPSYTKDDVVRQMHKATRGNTTVVVRPTDEPGMAADVAPARLSRLAHLRARGSLRIGYDPDNLPFSFFNADHELVGFDVEIAEALADALGLIAVFVPVTWSELPDMLADGRIDVMPGTWYRPNWLGRLRLSRAYLDGTMGFATLDARRHEFASIAALQRSRGLRIGVPLDRRQVEASIAHYFGPAEVDLVTIEFWKPYFAGEHPEIDAFLMPAENASGWTLLHPRYSVVVPQPDPVRIPSAMGLPLDAAVLAMHIDEWLVYADSAGLLRRAYDYWVLGQGAEPHARRWSVLHDVLHWGH
ncbi:MAG: transporter substrate-binding domain-containing protein [Gammaproteobacteria bacterium]